jgi:hypothetical protein
MSAAPMTASERLTWSRERMRQAMKDASSPPGEGMSQRIGGFAAPLLESLKSIPGAAVVIDAARTWWARHPLRIPSMMAADASNAAFRPMAQRYPLGLVLGAAVVGALLAWGRPWRWILRPALLAGLLPKLFQGAIAQMPVQSWLTALTSLAQERRRPDPPAAP